ncbi:sulfite exporter TauE/SafE family protein [Alcaligenes faecalis]|uniref:sulfite exporter TauE/SafE family protein n=1 Tax=Alcaligenes faecalis TaxID=511 RepID=UPI000F0B4041|nr:sulfite exporter TauE/SafE family protein [Alcaligenes faecalis]AYR21865.1 sulfite exporter TauE/SafE family protein [Alcaligenes faecalis]
MLNLELILACLLGGALIGYAGGVLGIGGGLLAIPLLGLILDMDQQTAQGTALIMVVPAVLLTVRQYHRRNHIDFRRAALGAVSSIIFTWLGARLALGMDAVLLRRIYSIFVMAIALYYFDQSLGFSRRRRRSNQPRPDPESFGQLWYIGVGMMAGLAGGVFGVGGAVLVVPFLTSRMGYSQTGAQGLALSMIIPGTLVALATYAFHGQATWQIGIPMAIGSLMLVPLGVRLAYRLPENRLKFIFACMLVLIVTLLLVRA